MSEREFTLERDDRGPLTFTGVQIAEVSSQRPGADFWTELRVYRVVKNGVALGWVVESVGATSVEGKRDFRTVKVCVTPSGVIDALKHNGHLVGLGIDAAYEAADNDLDDQLDDFMFEEEKL